MKDKLIYTLHANICKALASPVRIEIIDVLGSKEMTFGEIQSETNVLKSNLSQHLSLMVSSGILLQRKVGLNVYFKLSSEKIAQACEIMREVLIENLKKNHELIDKIS